MRNSLLLAIDERCKCFFLLFCQLLHDSEDLMSMAYASAHFLLYNQEFQIQMGLTQVKITKNGN